MAFSNKCTRERWDFSGGWRSRGVAAKCITESGELRECSVSKHITAAMACLNRVLMEGRRAKAGVKRVSVLFRQGACALSARRALTEF